MGIVAAYLSGLADSGRKSSTIGRRAAAIGYHHKMAGHEPPTNQEGVRAVLRGIRRTIGAAAQGKAPPPPTCSPPCWRSARTRSPATATAHCSLWASPAPSAAPSWWRWRSTDLTEVPDGLRVRIRRSKTDQEGQGAEIAIPRGYRLRPVEAVQAWLAAAEISAGPVFRPVLKGGRVQGVPLTPHSAAQIVKRYAERAGLDPAALPATACAAGS